MTEEELVKFLKSRLKLNMRKDYDGETLIELLLLTDNGNYYDAITLDKIGLGDYDKD